MVLLGAGDNRIELGAGLNSGIGAFDVPQGVTVTADGLEVTFEADPATPRR